MEGRTLANQLNDDADLFSDLAAAKYPEIDILSKRGGKEIRIIPRAPVAIPGLSHRGDHNREPFSIAHYEVYETIAENIRQLATGIDRSD